MKIEFDITTDTRPVPHQNNIVVTRYGGHKTKKLRDYQEMIVRYAMEVAIGEPIDIDAMLSCSIVFGYPGKVFPDLENIAKSTVDAMEGVMYRNDKQIHEMHLYRVLSEKGEYTIEIELEYD